MTTKEIAGVIFRAGYIKDKNAVKQKAKEDMRRLIACGILGNIKNRTSETDKEFLTACGLLSK